jgi:predicted DNA-binding WGR domain protein
MPDQIIVRHYLENTTPPYNKFYEITVVARNNRFCVDLRHGKVGVEGRLMRGKHTFTTRQMAEAKANQIKNSKLDTKKGYKEIGEKKKGKKKASPKKKDAEPMTFRQVRLNRFRDLLE